MNSKITIVALIAAAFIIALFPLFMLRGSEFEGSDDAGSELVNEITDGRYEPWVTPLIENAIGGEIPSEVETLFFCVQTGIGAGALAFCFGYLAARKKYGGLNP